MKINRIQKNGSEEFIYRTAMEKQTQRIDLRTWGEERRGEGEMYGKSNMETFTTRCKKIRQPVEICSMSQGTQTGALYQPRGVGREVQEGGDICTPMADSY